MDVLKAQLERIKQQLATLSASQRMLVGTLVAVMVLTLLYWGKYAGEAEMVPLLNSSLNEDEIGRIDMALQGKGIPHSVIGDRIMVPADRKTEIVADLMYNQALPKDSHSAFDDMNKDSNFFRSASDVDMRYIRAVETTLAQIISHFPDVSNARVVINSKSEHRIEESIEPSATVEIETRGKPASVKKLVNAAADGVAGAVSGLRPAKVNVIINGSSHHGTDAGPDSMASSGELMDMKFAYEDAYAAKVLSMFNYIPGLSVQVTANVENSKKTTHDIKHDGIVSKPVKEETTTEETNSTAGPAADPGAGANTGATINSSSGGGGTTSTTETTKNENAIISNLSDVITETGMGNPTVVSAAVRIPRSYVVNVYRQLNPSAKEPDDATLTSTQKSVLDSIREGTKKSIGLKLDDDVSVDCYADPSQSMMAATSITTPGQVMNVTSHVKEIAVGVLALVSMLMMFSMVRKATPAPVIAAVPLDTSPRILMADEGFAGEAGESGATLDGVELDDDAVHTQQMLEQVTTMVKENPDAAASLVKKWLNRT